MTKLEFIKCAQCAETVLLEDSAIINEDYILDEEAPIRYCVHCYEEARERMEYIEDMMDVTSDWNQR